MKMLNLPLIFAASVLTTCGNTGNKEDADRPGGAKPALSDASTTLPLEKITLPEGFKIEVYAEAEDARSMVMSPSGVLYVGNRDKNSVYALQDTDGDHKADLRWTIATGLNMPNGVAFNDGDLYVAEVSRILKFPAVEADLSNPPAAVVVNDNYPSETHHGWKYIAFGPDGKLYVPVGAPCNICEPDEIYASITRINADGSGREIIAHGIRNTVGFTWHPDTGELWFTDNGRDQLGNDVPPCELNRLAEEGAHFGYPYCHGGDISDPEFGKKRDCAEFTKPAQRLGPHVAPLGLKFYTGTAFPEAYRGHLFIAEHGSWNRDKKIGYRVSLVKVSNGVEATSYETFASGWLDEDKQEAWGRPVDVLILKDGSMLVSDDKAGVIYRISYSG